MEWKKVCGTILVSNRNKLRRCREKVRGYGGERATGRGRQGPNATKLCDS